MAFPTTSVIDNFNRANENPVSDGGKWSVPVFSGDGALGVESNRLAKPVAISWGSAYRNDVTPGPDCEVFYTFAAADGAHELLLRLQSPGLTGVDGYLLDVSSGFSWSIWRITDNNQTQVGASTTQGFSPGDGVGFEAIGSTLKGYLRVGGVWSEVLSRTDSTWDAAGRIGVALQIGTQVDDFGGGTISTGTSFDVTGTLNLGLMASGAVAKSAGSAGILTLNVSPTDDASKTAEAAGQAFVELAADADAQKVGEAVGQTDLALSTAADAQKLADAIGAVALELGLTGAVSSEALLSTAGDVSLSMLLNAVAAKDAEAAAALALAISLAASSEKSASVAGSLGLALTASGSVGALAEDAVSGTVALSLATLAVAQKSAAAQGSVGFSLGTNADAQKAADSAGTLEAILALSSLPSKTGFTTGSLVLLLSVAGTPGPQIDAPSLLLPTSASVGPWLASVVVGESERTVIAASRVMTAVLADDGTKTVEITSSL